MGLPYCPLFFTSLSISQTNPLVLARITELPEIPPIGPLGSWGYDECLLYGNDQAKLKVFRVGPEWLENQSRFLNYTTYHFWLQMLQLISVLRSFVEINHSTISFSVWSFFFNFFFFMEKSPNKIPILKNGFQPIFFPEGQVLSSNTFLQVWIASCWCGGM